MSPIHAENNLIEPLLTVHKTANNRANLETLIYVTGILYSLQIYSFFLNIHSHSLLGKTIISG